MNLTKIITGLCLPLTLILVGFYINWITATFSVVFLFLGYFLATLATRAHATDINAEEAPSDETAKRADFQRVVDQVNEITSEQLHYLESEQKQVAELIDEAVRKLSTSFDSMNQISDEQHHIFSDIFKHDDNHLSFEEFVNETDELLNYFVEMVLKNGKDSVYLMQRLDDMVEKVNAVLALLESVKSVSSSINLLSLNASIEAARAGEAGRGFSVVAEEIRSLSNQADDISDQINHLSTDMIEKLDTVTEVVNRVASSDMNAAMDGRKRVAEMTSYLKQENAAVNQSLYRSEELSETNAQAVGQAVISLQFEDICRQLLEHLSKRLDIVKKVNEVGQGLQSVYITNHDLGHYQAQLDELSQKLSQIEPAIKDSQHQSVHQKNLDTSDVELF